MVVCGCCLLGEAIGTGGKVQGLSEVDDADDGGLRRDYLLHTYGGWLREGKIFSSSGGWNECRMKRWGMISVKWEHAECNDVRGVSHCLRSNVAA